MEFTTIESNVYERYVNKIRVTYKYWVSESDIWWYSYDDIIEFLNLSEKYAIRVYDELNDYDKTMCYDGTVFDKYGNNRSQLKRWVTSDAIRKIVQRNNDRGNALIKSMNNLEFVEDAHCRYNDGLELRSRIDNMCASCQSGDYEVGVSQMYRIINSESGRDMLDKLGIINKKVETKVDEYRNSLLIDDYEDDFEPMTKRDDAPDEEQRRLLYKKHRAEGKKSTCPTWLKDVLR